MRYLIPVLFLASPAVAHPTSLTHIHASDWAVQIAMVLIVVAAVVAQRRAVRAKK